MYSFPSPFLTSWSIPTNNHFSFPNISPVYNILRPTSFLFTIIRIKIVTPSFGLTLSSLLYSNYSQRTTHLSFYLSFTKPTHPNSFHTLDPQSLLLRPPLQPHIQIDTTNTYLKDLFPSTFLFTETVTDREDSQALKFGLKLFSASKFPEENH